MAVGCTEEAPRPQSIRQDLLIIQGQVVIRTIIIPTTTNTNIITANTPMGTTLMVDLLPQVAIICWVTTPVEVAHRWVSINRTILIIVPPTRR
jgi:hypothetical protein